MNRNTLISIGLREEDINLITFALRKLENQTAFPTIKEESDNLIKYIEYLHNDFKIREEVETNNL